MTIKVERVAPGFWRWRCVDCQVAGVGRNSKPLARRMGCLHEQSCSSRDGERRQRARRIIGLYERRGLRGKAAVIDLLGDLAIYADREGLDFDAILREFRPGLEGEPGIS